MTKSEYPPRACHGCGEICRLEDLDESELCATCLDALDYDAHSEHRPTCGSWWAPSTPDWSDEP
jgi:hypothetical protein